MSVCKHHIPTDLAADGCTQVAACRRGELRGLAVRKYLDALCVYFWAATQLLFSVLTFGLVVLLGQSLR